MTTDELDTLAIAKAELAQAMVPAPEDILSELGPMGQLFFVQQVTMQLGLAYSTELSTEADDDAPGDDPRSTAIAAIMTAAGNLTAACIAVGMLPDEAGQG